MTNFRALLQALTEGNVAYIIIGGGSNCAWSQQTHS